MYTFLRGKETFKLASLQFIYFVITNKISTNTETTYFKPVSWTIEISLSEDRKKLIDRWSIYRQSLLKSIAIDYIDL